MSALLLIRHAETAMAGTFCGHSDPPVNERGWRQIEKLVKALEGTAIDSIYASDLERAVTTAEALAQAFRLPFVVTPRLREINFGEWEGLRWREIERRDAAYARKWSEAYPRLPAPGGESFAAFELRVLAEARHLLQIAGQGCLAAVTHAGVMRAVLRALAGLDEREAWERTNSYCSFFLYTGEASLQRAAEAVPCIPIRQQEKNP